MKSINVLSIKIGSYFLKITANQPWFVIKHKAWPVFHNKFADKLNYLSDYLMVQHGENKAYRKLSLVE